MSDFIGFCSLKRDLSRDIHIIKNMNTKLEKGAKHEEEYFNTEKINLGYRKLIVKNVKTINQPMSIKYGDTIYTIVYNGQIYNKDEIRKELKEAGYEIERIFR